MDNPTLPKNAATAEAYVPEAPHQHSTPIKITLPALQEKKRSRTPIVALTAYDYASARVVDEAGIDLVLVGDSLAMVMLGYESTLPVTVDEMLLFTRAVRRGVRRAVLVADMPFGSYHASVAEGVTNAVRFLKEAGAEAVKIEGGRSREGFALHAMAAHAMHRLRRQANVTHHGNLGLDQRAHQLGTTAPAFYLHRLRARFL